MKLKRALELRMEYRMSEVIHVDKNGYICLNDLNRFYPSKRIDKWKKLDSTLELIQCLDNEVKTPVRGKLKRSIISKSGRYGGGTYACKELAMDFAMYLSVEFKLKVLRAYEDGVERQEKWDIKRELAAQGYNLLKESINDAHEEPRGYHFSNEADLINILVFGKRKRDLGYCPRDKATTEQLKQVTAMQTMNAVLIDLDYDRAERFRLLSIKLAKINEPLQVVK
jgi:hypothetical protein